MQENRYIEDIQYETRKKLNIFHDRSPASFNHIDSYTDVDQHTLHVHPHVEVYFCISRYVDYVVGDAYYALRPGDIVIIRPGAIHKVVIREPHQYERFFIALPTDPLPEPLLAPLSALLKQTEHRSARLRPSAQVGQSIHAMLYDALSICHEGSTAQLAPLVQTRVYSLCLQILCTLCEHADDLLPAERRADRTELSELISDVYIYMEKHLKEIQNVAEIAKAVHVSPPYLSALFRKHLGVPLIYHLQSLKMSLAKQMLEEGYTVADVCRELGYTDCSYFIRIFKRHLGMTPLKYRAAFCAGKEEGDPSTLRKGGKI
ncbi:MAG: helix-turn-helix domain-containing protein [Clostridia bacterium]|nr:helix-turn-helix domain-containing protein [Clostridia bacterium]